MSCTNKLLVLMLGADPQALSRDKDNAVILATFAGCHPKCSNGEIIEILANTGGYSPYWSIYIYLLAIPCHLSHCFVSRYQHESCKQEGLLCPVHSSS